MAKSDYFTLPTAQAELFIEKNMTKHGENDYRARMSGVEIYVDSRSEAGIRFELYGGNSATRDRLEREIVAAFGKEAEAAKAPAAAEAATPRQIAYLRVLIAEDPGLATNIGAHTRPGLTKADASRFIEYIKSEM